VSFHDTRFPIDIARGAVGGPERRTDIVTLGSGAEERNARWADSRRRWNAGYGVKSTDDLATVLAFFEERRGRLYGFRWRDPVDHKSCAPSAAPAATDQVLGTGTGSQVQFQLRKRYGTGPSPWFRTITKPVVGSVVIAVAGTLASAATYTVDHLTGRIMFSHAATPASGANVTAGFLFDVPVRFDTDVLDVNLSGFASGAIPSIPLVEIRA
jgi:uncharacterized protein (TIGR02217 family)